MKKPSRSLWLMPLAGLVFFGAAFVTLRAAEQATARAAPPATLAKPTPPPPSHPAPSAPEESATIADDPTTAPDPAQSADNTVSFPADI
jgi:hypothetical protein